MKGHLRLAIVLAAVAPVLGCSRAPSGAGAREAQIKRHEQLRARLAGLVADDPMLAQARADSSRVILAVREGFLEEVFREATYHYLNRITLDLPLKLDFHHTEEFRPNTFLGRVKAGSWSVDLTVHRVTGVLRAKAPSVKVSPGERIHLSLPMALAEGHGSVTIRFAWKPTRLAGVVCGDFEYEKRLEGNAIPHEYTFEGDFLLSTEAGAIVADPKFPPLSFQLYSNPTSASWEEIRQAITSQDTLSKCGIVLDPEDVLGRLRRRVQDEGFRIKLPRSLLSTIEFPAGLEQNVEALGRRVEIAMRPKRLRSTPGILWYGAEVDVQPTHSSPASPGR